MEIAAKPAFSPDSSLIKDVSAGFFRTTFGRRNRFINATGRTLEIIGFNTLEELLPHYIDNFFADASVLKSIRSSLALKKNVYNRVAILRRRNGEEFTALISVVVVETDSHGIWCEGSVEELTASSSRLVRAIPDLSRYSASFTLEAPVSSIMKPVVECPENTSVSSCLSLMKTKDTGAVIITDKNGMPLGVFQASDAVLLQREEAGQKLPVTELMSSPPSFLDKNSPITEAFRMMAEISCKVIAVTGPDNRLCGMLTTEELLASFSAAPDIIISGIKNALSEEELREMFINSRKLAVSMILGQADPYAVSLYLASIADAVCGRAVELCLRQAGDPPCRFAFIHTGSAGRQEQTLLTDQDNAIIFEDLAGKDLEEASRYFVSLGKKINEMLNTAGYKLCPGNNMAGNPEWCQPLSVWKKYFTGWIKTPGPEEILKTSIFFDFRYCAGDPGLVSSLRDHVRNNLKTNDIYFHHVALAWKQFSPSESMLSSGKTNIKKILMPLTGIVRLYALKHSLEGLSTPDRITELYSGNHLDIQMLRRLLKAWKDLSSIRFSHQASCIARNKDPDNDMDFRMAEFEARSFAINAISSINDIMLKAGTDFYTEVI
jgi:CBS domain-containing protein